MVDMFLILTGGNGLKLMHIHVAVVKSFSVTQQLLGPIIADLRLLSSSSAAGGVKGLAQGHCSDGEEETSPVTAN